MALAACVFAVLFADSGHAQQTGPSLAPKATVQPSDVNFAPQLRGTTSDRADVTLENEGDGDLTLAGFEITGAGSDFAIDNAFDGACAPGVLVPGSSCRVGIRFTPTDTGPRQATLTFTTDDPATPPVALRGIGNAPPPPPPPPPPLIAPMAAPPPSDFDKDGVVDGADTCPGTPGELSNGCPGDSDRDDVLDARDSCIHVAGNLKNGCPSELNADVTGRWRVNNLRSQLLSLVVRTATGSRIELRCGKRGGCGFTRRTIHRTTKRLTSLTRHFRGRRILRANVSIIIRVTRPQQIGTYESLRTRTRRKLPRVTQRCIVAQTRAKITRCG
jgi:hypothetical protein